MSDYTVLAVCNHPGGANAIFPVLVELQRQGANCYSITSGSAVSKFINAGIKNKVIVDRINHEAAERLLHHYRPDVVLLGTSELEDPVIGRCEAHFTAAARNIGIPTIAVLDHWCGYKDRFSLSNDLLLDALPDVVCIMDKSAYQDMAKLGFPEKRLIITGNPCWDALTNIRRDLDQMDNQQLREDMGIDKEKHLVLFVSQSLFKDYGFEYGYRELRVIEDLIQAVGRNSDTVIWIKPHPREDVAKFTELLRIHGEAEIKIVDDKMNLYHIGKVADVIVGMTSGLLVEYSLLGLPVISYQPVAREKIPVRLGYGVVLLTELTELQDRLHVQTYSDSSKNRDISLNATEQVIKVLNKLVDEVKRDGQAASNIGGITNI